MDNRKKIATITWLKYNNYGTLLQCYALQRILEELGYDNYVLDDSHIIEPYQKTFRYIIASSCYCFLSKLLNPFGIKKYNIVDPVIVRKCRQFVSKYIKVDYAINNLDDVSKRYDCFICGSDQIWNPGPSWYSKLNTSFYYAGFTDKKKIAYAPSLGVKDYPENRKDEFVYYLSSFAALSCREEEGCKIINELTGEKVKKVVDPTLLLDEKRWRNLIGEKKRKGGYVLCYFLTPQPWYWQFLHTIKTINDLKVLSIYTQYQPEIEPSNVVYTGPREFLEYIDGANLVLTDSFHATLFSAILQTPFYTLERFPFGSSEYAQNLRLKNLNEMMGVFDRYVTDPTSKKISNYETIDFISIRNNINHYSVLSIEYLKESLK